MHVEELFEEEINSVSSTDDGVYLEILIDNKSSILHTINMALGDQLMFLSRFNFCIKIDYIHLCNKYPVEYRKLLNLNQTTITINRFLNNMIKKVLGWLNYTNIEAITANNHKMSNQLTVNPVYYFTMSFTGFTVLNTQPVILEQREIIQNGVTCDNHYVNQKKLFFIEVTVEKYSGKQLENGPDQYLHTKNYICGNNTCPNKTILMTTLTKTFYFTENDRVFKENHEKTKNYCDTCKNKLSLYLEEVIYTYEYNIHYRNMIYNGISHCNLEDGFYLIAGYLERNHLGHNNFMILEATKKEDWIYKSKYDLSAETIDEYLSEYIRLFKIDQITPDLKCLIIILNMFNIIDYRVAQNNNIVMQYYRNFKVIIYTNDVRYVTHIAKLFLRQINISNINDLGANRALIILDLDCKMPKKYDIRKFNCFKLQFNEYPSYQYNKADEINLEQNFYSDLNTETIQEIYLTLRKLHKGSIPPENLLNLTDLLFHSITSITKNVFKDPFIKRVLLTLFSKSIV
ncbi:hypothetical protein ECANGB1_607 [Enterospora canceri]|uniref:Uncharacterized protein n=1 Tax=Enterospora canceri TaxID=1081671 RepID=A0A1Y1S7X6_9MICR|nr:hypothetical protein ECANGB1_607 [Enterospora canceri]